MDLHLENYVNILDLQGFDVDGVLASCVDINYEKNRVIDDRVENGVRWPPFVRAFIAFVVSNNKVPSQEDFFYYYIGVNYKTFLPLQLNNDIYNALKARLTRSYPSLVRDMHFACSLKKKRQDLEVFYNPELDVKNDIDTLVIHNGMLKAFVLYVDTFRGNGFRKRKANRHNRFNNVTYYEIPMTLGNVAYNKVGLYDISVIEKMSMDELDSKYS